MCNECQTSPRTSLVRRLTVFCRCALTLCAALLLCSCATRTGLRWDPEDHSRPVELSLIYPGDELEIAFREAPELSIVRTVRRDGRMNLRFLGDVEVVGKTPPELQKELQQRYSKHVQASDVSVTIRSNPPVFVSGAVMRPGRFLMDYPMTAFQAVAEAGGFDEEEAETRNVLVIRHDNGQRFGYSINMRPSLAGKSDPVFHLRPFDIVYVPRTPIAKVNQWIDQYINRLVPRAGGGLSVADDGGLLYGP